MKKNIDLACALGLPPLPSSSPDAISALLWARDVLQEHISITYGVKDPKGIEELRAVKIGGVDQWLHIRGRNRKNPILLYLHGGPGSSFIGYMDAIIRPWEDYFTVVCWDQRQTGKSYYPADDENSPLTVNRFIEDTEELIQYLLDYLDQEKLFVLGASWGSVLGMYMAKRHPDWMHAYIGCGQVVNLVDNETLLFKRAVNFAREQGDSQAVERLEAMAPYPDPKNIGKSFATHHTYIREELSRLAGDAGMRHLPLGDAIRMLNLQKTISPHLTLGDISNSILGDEPAMFRPPYSFTKDFMAIDLPNDIGSTFEVPIFFFSGSHDWQTPTVLSDKWFGEIKAPYKELVHFEESSHFIVNEEPGKVLTALVNKVLPAYKNTEKI